MSKDKRLDQIELPSETDHAETEPSQPKITMRFKPLDELEGKHWHIIIDITFYVEKEEDFEVFDQKYLSRYRSRKVFKPKV